MQPSDSGFMTTMFNNKDHSPFMRLPTEVREMIYRYLLVASYTMREHNMRSKEFDDHRETLLGSSDQIYEFSTAILRTNSRIYEEARDLCRRENDFVCLTSQEPSRLGYELERDGLQMLATGTKAQDFWNVSMTVTLDPGNLGGWPPRRSCHHKTSNERPWKYISSCDAWCHEVTDATDASEDGRPWKYIFSRNELPTFCKLLVKWRWHSLFVLTDTVIYVDVNSSIWNGQATEMDSYPAGLSRVGKLLEPLHQLHSFGEAYVSGPLSAKYKMSIYQSVWKDCPTALEITNTVMGLLGQGDELVSENRLPQANSDYKAALSYARSCSWFYDERDLIVESEPFPGLTATQVLSNLEVRLLARIASVYLESGMQRMARIYTERALDPRRPYDRGWKVYDVDIEPWEGVVYAEVLHVAARNSYTYRKVWEAVGHLRDARKLVPLNEEQKSRLEAWQNHGNDLFEKRARREEGKRLCLEKRDEKTEGSFLVACNWKLKGDRLLRDGRSELAVSKYGVALTRIESMRQSGFTLKTGAFEGYVARDAINALKFKIQAGIVASYLMSGRHQDVIQSAETAFQRNDEYPYCNRYYNPYWNNNRVWAEDQKLDYARIHYCLALSLESMGDTALAIVEMEKAKGFDPQDSKIYGQLKLLRQKQKQKVEEDEIQIRRIEKLNSRQIQPRRKQGNRKAKARGKSYR